MVGLSAEAPHTYGSQYMYLSTVIVSLPWMRYILASHKPTLRSYFTWDKAYVVAMAYTILLFGLPMFLLEQGLYTPFMGKAENGTNLLIYFGCSMLVIVITGPFEFIFPAISLDKPFSLRQTFRDVLPFYGQYLISFFLALLRITSIMLLLFAIVFCTILLAVFHPEYIPAGVGPYLMEIFLLVALLAIYFWLTYSCTILAAYYKKHLMK